MLEEFSVDFVVKIVEVKGRLDFCVWAFAGQVGLIQPSLLDHVRAGQVGVVGDDGR